MKRFLCSFFCVLIIIASFPVSVFAEKTPVISVESATAYAGEQVKLNLRVENNTGIKAMYIDIDYSDALELDAVYDKAVFGDKMFAEDISSKPYRLSWDESLSDGENSANGVIAELYFSVKDETPSGEYYVNISYDKEEIYDSDLNNVFFNVKNGKVTVIDEGSFSDDTFVGTFKLYGVYAFFAVGTPVGSIGEQNSLLSRFNSDVVRSSDILILSDKSRYTCICLGDVNFDGELTASDARTVLRASVGLERLSDDEKAACDIDFSGDITASDARSILRASVSLESSDDWLEEIGVNSLSREAFQKNAAVFSEKLKNAGEYVVSQLNKYESVIDISSFGIKTTEIETLILYYIFEDPSLFFVGSEVSYSYYNGAITYLEVEISNDAAKKKAEYTKKISDIVSNVDLTWSDLEKALFLHDYICENFSYDTSYKIYDAYSMLVNKKGVCQAYSLLYKELLRQVGVQSEYVSSNSMNHGWNIVKIGSKWYHVDVTWDDPIPDRYSMVSHKYFLMSDTEAVNKAHNNWRMNCTSVKCDSTAFDKTKWKNSESPFVNFDGEWYFVYDNDTVFGLYKTDFASYITFVKQFNNYWTSTGLGKLDNMLIYNSHASVYGYFPKSKVETVLFENNSEEYIYGCRVVDGGVYCVISSSFEFSPEDIVSVPVKRVGDLNSDGIVNAKDYTLLIRYLSGYDVVTDINFAAVDYNGDGLKNKDDAYTLRVALVNKYS